MSEDEGSPRKAPEVHEEEEVDFNEQMDEKPDEKDDDEHGKHDDDEEGRGRKRARPEDKEGEELVTKLLEKPIAKRADTRGRRLLGSMMGHLMSAKTRLNKEGLLDPAKRRAAVAKADKARLEKEVMFGEKKLDRQYGWMKKYIQTQAEPPIFYLPRKHTAKTEALLDDSREAVEQKVNLLKAQLRHQTFSGLIDNFDSFEYPEKQHWQQQKQRHDEYQKKDQEEHHQEQEKGKTHEDEQDASRQDAHEKLVVTKKEASPRKRSRSGSAPRGEDREQDDHQQQQDREQQDRDDDHHDKDRAREREDSAPVQAKPVPGSPSPSPDE
eukprot:CAMPEP_0194759644 /NCGR_PEP_ID=MMETSP0323_2-20130528/12674_1 /TAXON_ID=2866 ORGANISM="Crypthecodinium cohnii, Strain Seligo" /NCGR_SAMPLE_ID=MMETSP0323_2 /ASSEMBLY_ACC=CAM_ASM_000346 /LENGTH=324 /DNA_ID=CAMNT_0039680499 /DNA_START=42 /DNA_END=1016 /DNA_ORIENTATION=+